MARRPDGQLLQERLSRSFRRIPAEDVPRIYRIPLAEIDFSPDQPRRHFDPEAMAELAASIERHGLIQPITVKRLEGTEGYLLIAGERRYRAHRMLGREDILAIITTGDPDEISLIENIQRQDLHPLEEAAAYARMMALHGWTQEQMAHVVGKARPTITNLLKLNDLPEAIRTEAVQQTDISKSVLFEIARLDDPEAQINLWRQARGGATVRSMRGRRPAPSRADAGDMLADVLVSGQGFLDRLRKLPPDRLSDRDGHREKLLELRWAINEALDCLFDA